VLGFNLRRAVQDGDFGEVKRLVGEVGAPVDAADSSGMQALHCAIAYTGHLEMVKFLIAAGAQIDDATQENGWQAVHYAAWNGHLAVVKYLIGEKGAKMEAADSEGRQVLHVAAYGGQLGVVEYLVRERGADVFAKTRDGSTPIDLADDVPDVREFLQEWMEAEETRACIRNVLARQRKLGALRPRNPGL